MYRGQLEHDSMPYLCLVIIRLRHDPAENLHFLRQLRCQVILALVSLLLLGVEHNLPLWSRYSLQLTVIVRVMTVMDSTRLEVLFSDEESDETK